MGDWLIMASSYRVVEAHHCVVLFTFFALVPDHLTLIGAAFPYAFFKVTKPWSSQTMHTAIAEWERVAMLPGSKQCAEAQSAANHALFHGDGFGLPVRNGMPSLGRLRMPPIRKCK